jgi:hypothetical protein
MSDRPVLDSLDDLIDDEERHEEPLMGDHWMPEPVLNLNVQRRGLKDPMDQLLENLHWALNFHSAEALGRRDISCTSRCIFIMSVEYTIFISLSS